MATTEQSPRTVSSPADEVLAGIRGEIAVPRSVLREARHRRDLVLEIAVQHQAARDPYGSGSVMHGTTNRPLEDADGGVKVNRHFEASRQFGPDAPGGGEGPERFIQMFAAFVGPRLRERYPNAEVNLDGNRAIKFEFNETVEIDDWGPVDPYVDLIVGLSRAEGSGLWIPNRSENDWDPADPELHNWLMTERDEKPLRVHRAQLVRLAKRAIKRDDLLPDRTKVLCSWNISALALECVGAPRGLAEGLAGFFAYASASIARALTDDPSPVIEEPIGLPDGVSEGMASQRLAEMAEIVHAARQARTPGRARAELAVLYGDEIDSIKARERHDLDRGLRTRDSAAVASAVSVPAMIKPTRSDGA